MHSVLESIFQEARMRVLWCIVCILITQVCCYTFAEEFLFLLARPFLFTWDLSIPFLCTHLTEALTTTITTSVVLSVFFCTPHICYQLWCFCIPSCKYTQRRVLCMCVLCCGLLCVFMLYTTIRWIMPSVGYFLYHCCDTSTNQLMIQLQPKIYDFIMFTLRFLFFSSVCSQIPIIMLCLIEYQVISLRSLIINRKTFVLASVLISALITPPDVWCQLGAFLPIYLIIEFTLLLGLIRFHYKSVVK